MKKGLFFVLLALLLLTLAACTASPNALEGTNNADGELAGFWRGLWHGFIAPFAFILSLFREGIDIYEAHNSGGWYNFGFLLGASMIFGGSGGGATRRYYH